MVTIMEDLRSMSRIRVVVARVKIPFHRQRRLHSLLGAIETAARISNSVICLDMAHHTCSRLLSTAAEVCQDTDSKMTQEADNHSLSRVRLMI